MRGRAPTDVLLFNPPPSPIVYPIEFLSILLFIEEFVDFLEPLSFFFFLSGFIRRGVAVTNERGVAEPMRPIGFISLSNDDYGDAFLTFFFFRVLLLGVKSVIAVGLVLAELGVTLLCLDIFWTFLKNSFISSFSIVPLLSISNSLKIRLNDSSSKEFKSPSNRFSFISSLTNYLVSL